MAFLSFTPSISKGGFSSWYPFLPCFQWVKPQSGQAENGKCRGVSGAVLIYPSWINRGCVLFPYPSWINHGSDPFPVLLMMSPGTSPHRGWWRQKGVLDSVYCWSKKTSGKKAKQLELVVKQPAVCAGVFPEPPCPLCCWQVWLQEPAHPIRATWPFKWEQEWE